MEAHLWLYAAHNKSLRSCRTPIVMIMNSSARITGDGDTPLWCLRLLSVIPHNFFLRIILYTHPCVQSNRFIIYTTLCNATNILYTQHFLLKIRNSKISSFCYAHKRPSPFFLYIPTIPSFQR